MDDASPLPSPPDDPENLSRLREEAERRVAQEEQSIPPGHSGSQGRESSPQPAYGGPSPVAHRRNLVKLLLAGFTALWGILLACRLMKRKRSDKPGASHPTPPTPAYGGPPIHQEPPAPDRPGKPHGD
jgi:hypothetical protein